jgi:hypothetical protein
VRYDRTVLGYHGCTKEVAERVLAGEAFRPSENDYDWLGKGTYFWEHGPDRAGLWSTPSNARKPRAVVGALIQLGRCFDLMDTKFTKELTVAYGLFQVAVATAGGAMPSNAGKTASNELRRLDCAVINFYLDTLAARGEAYDTVRCGFVEGQPAFPGSAILEMSHVQIAVRNPDCIVGIFQPR